MTRLSRVALGLTLLLALVLPIVTAAWWFVASDRDIGVAAGVPAADFALDTPTRLAAALVSALPALALSWGLCRLATTLRLFGSGTPFLPQAARGLRDFGLGVLACAILKPVAAAALSLLITWGPGPKSLAINVSSDTLLLLLIGVVMTLVGWVLAEAARIAEENAQFI